MKYLLKFNEALDSLTSNVRTSSDFEGLDREELLALLDAAQQ